MKRLDYLLHTSRGNYLSYRERYRKRLSFAIKQEPFSKKSMRDSEKQRFHQGFVDYMRTSGRLAFRGPVLLQLDFFPTKGNPPSIHHLAKNYIDLLYPRESKRLRLPMRDDRQISILIVNYHVQFENDQPLVKLTMAPMGDFLKDLVLYNTLITGHGFKEDDGDYDYEPEDLLGKENDNREFERSLESLKNFREFVAERGSGDSPRKLEQILIRDIQSAFLRMNKFSPRDLAFMYDTNEIGDMLDTIFTEHRKLIISSPFSPLQPVGLPTAAGETETFKDTIRAMVNEYANCYPVFSPVLVNLSLTILYIPPKEQEIDLDNLARHIVPLVNEAIQPPAGFWFAEVPKKFPKHTIIQYQVIKLPRSNQDPEDGLTRLILSEHEPYNNIWKEVDKLIDSWSERVF